MGVYSMCSLSSPCFDLLFLCDVEGLLTSIVKLSPYVFVYALSLQAPLDHNSEMSLTDSQFEPGGKRNFLQLTDKDGEQPQIASVSGAGLANSAPYILNDNKNAAGLVRVLEAEDLFIRRVLLKCVMLIYAQDESGAADSSGLDDSSQERFIGPLPRDGSAGGSGDYSSPSYTYSSILSKSETGKVGFFLNV